MDMTKSLLTYWSVLYCMMTFSIAEDCNPELKRLLRYVTKDNVTQSDCDTARIGIQHALARCESSDPPEFVRISLEFSKAFRDIGDDCHGTDGRYPECHKVPYCYRYVSRETPSGDLVYDCGENRNGPNEAMACVQEAIDAGCVQIGSKVKSYHEAAMEANCPPMNASSVSVSSAILISTALLLNIFRFFGCFD